MLIGVYKDKKLIHSYKSSGKTSDELPKIFQKINNRFDITALYYAKGPGSFMAIKVSYVFLKTFALVKNIPFKAVDGFYFNNNSPIKAIGKRCFVKDENNITFDTIDIKKVGEFSLPKKIVCEDFSDDTLPMYILPAV